MRSLLLMLLLAMPSVAHADPGSVEHESPPPRATTEHTWYGWQPLLVDASVLGAMLAVRSEYVAGAGLGAFVIGAPITHLAHERWGAALGSFGVRVALPITAAVVGSSNCRPSEEGACMQAAAYGAFLGMAAASLIDAFALSWEAKPAAVTPTASVSASGVTFGLSGVF